MMQSIEASKHAQERYRHRFDADASPAQIKEEAQRVAEKEQANP